MFLQGMSTSGSYLNTCHFAPCERYSSDTRIFNQLFRLRTWNKNRSEDSLWDIALLKYTLDFQGNVRDVRGMLEDGCVARHQSRSGKTKDLPVWEVPGHDCQDNAQRTEGNITLSRIC